MLSRRKSMFLSLGLLLAGTALHADAEVASAKTAATPVSYGAAIAAKRAEEVKNIKAPDGWLSLIALEWIKPDADLTVGTGPANHLKLQHGVANAFTLRLSGNAVHVVAADPSILVHGKHVKPGDVLESNEDPDTALHWGTLSATVIKREDRLYLRVRDTRSPDLLQFHGLKFYPVDRHFRVQATWVPYTTPHEIAMPTQTGQVLKLPAPGYAEFELDGAKVKLEPFEQYGGSLAFLFRDTTSRTTTYGSGREVFTAAPSNGLTSPGTVTLDFNEAFNPPCAYTPFGTCPLPPPSNRLQVAIPAGEKRYHE